MQTGLHQWLLNNPTGCVLLDVLFYSAPALYFLHYTYKPKSAMISAIWMVVVNWVYVQCYTLYPSNSIEGHIAWLLFPFVFTTKKDETFTLLLNALRYFFIYFFVSAGLWKLREGGLFNHEQMSGILLFQHAQLITNSPGYWQTNLVKWLIKHAWVSYSLYIVATVMELSFIVGFFTRKFDKVLAGLFILFLLMDNFVMNIPYYEVLPLVLTLYPGLRQQAAEPAEATGGSAAIAI